jgi:hypothetical protein
VDAKNMKFCFPGVTVAVADDPSTRACLLGRVA